MVSRLSCNEDECVLSALRLDSTDPNLHYCLQNLLQSFIQNRNSLYSPQERAKAAWRLVLCQALASSDSNCGGSYEPIFFYKSDRNERETENESSVIAELVT